MNISYGADPEIFFTKGGHVIGSEKVISDGLIAGLIIDGVQAELNPHAEMSIGGLQSNIKAIFGRLQTHLEGIKEVEVSFKSFVDVSKKELKSLSDTSRVLGCKPSYNIYGIPPMSVDPKTYTKRSTGGHIHIGLTYPLFQPNLGVDQRKRLIPILDMIVGNTCVLIDRDMDQVERRTVYGRPGEFRLTDYGLEYRTLSNFWLQDPSLTAFVMELTKLSVTILTSALDPTTMGLPNKRNLEKGLYTSVGNLGTIIKAILTNDFDLALDNFNKVFKTIYEAKCIPTYFPPTLEKCVEGFTNVQAKGLLHVIGNDPLKAWQGHNNMRTYTFTNTFWKKSPTT